MRTVFIKYEPGIYAMSSDTFPQSKLTVFLHFLLSNLFQTELSRMTTKWTRDNKVNVTHMNALEATQSYRFSVC